MNKHTALVTSLCALLALVFLCLAVPILLRDSGEWWKQTASAPLPIDNPNYLYQQAEDYYRSGDIGMAHDIANRAIIVQPNFVAAHKLLATICLKDKRYAEAESVLRHAAKLNPTDANIQVGLGMALSGMGRSVEAEQTYRKVLVNADMAGGEPLGMAPLEAQEQLLKLQKTTRTMSPMIHEKRPLDAGKTP